MAAAFGTALLVSLSALGPLASPEADALGQTYAGQHISFCTTAGLVMVALVVILVLVRDSKRPAQTVSAKTAAKKASSPAAEHKAEKATQPETDAEQAAGEVFVRDAMNLNPVYVSAAATMRDVVLIMAETDTSGVPVVDEDYHVVGFVTDGDMAKYLAKNNTSVFDASYSLYSLADGDEVRGRLKKLLDLNVESMATKRVIATTPDTPIDEAIQVLSSKRIKKMPVVDEEGKLIGSLSRRNIVHAIAADEQHKSEVEAR